MKIVAIDPGTIKCGVACFEKKDNIITPIAYKQVTTIKAKILMRDLKTHEKFDVRFLRCEDLLNKINHFVADHKPDLIICEFPQPMGGERGEAAARTGSTILISFFCGLLAQIFLDGGYEPEELIFVTPSTWKGNVPKEITQKRILKRYGIKGRDDMVDALGIGDWYMRKGYRKLKK